MNEETPQKIEENLSPAPAANKELELNSLTEQNWLFINAFLKLGNVKKAYEMAGYKGESRAAPYVLFKHLKSVIEDLANLDVTSRARLQADLKQVLDLPLAESKKELTLSEWLRVRKFVAAISPEVQQPAKQISVLVINRSAAKREMDTPNVGNGTNTTTDLNLNDVIDVEPLK